MTGRSRLYIGLTVTGLLLVAGVLWGTEIIPRPFMAGEPSPVLVESEDSSGPPWRSSGGGTNPSWAYTYHGFSDMCTHSDVISIGIAARIIESREEDTMLYMTYWDFKVEEILKGEKRGNLTVGQMGSPDVSGSDIKADPLFITGDRYLIFLKESEKGNLYYHPQGRYFIWDDKVYSMNYILSEGSALPSVPGIDCNGVEMDVIEDKITEMVDSVQLIFTHYKARIPGDVTRYPAGLTISVYANLFTGNNGPGKISYNIDQEKLHDGITVYIRQAEFDAEPYSEYESTLIITTDSLLPAGSYQIPVEYDFEGVGSGSRILTYNVN
jgi:hypothetical protein